MELVLNLLIGIDFVCRMKLVGVRKYFRNPADNKLRWWNIFDAIVVTVCNVVFAVSLISAGGVRGFEEISEEFLLVVWCVW